MTPLAQRIARLCVDFGYDQIPPDVLVEVRRRVLDTVGCIVAGAGARPVDKVWDGTACLGDSEQATVVGRRARASVVRAITMNCSALRYLDFMDGHPGPYPAHVSFNAVPALAAAEAGGASGRDLVTSIVLGYEFGIRLQLGVGAPSIQTNGWSGSLHLGTTTAIVIGKLLRLSVPELTSAIGTATMHAPTLDIAARGQMPENKVCVDGLVAGSAAIATYLVQAGISGPARVFEGAGGVAEAFAGRVDADLLAAPLDRFRILDVYTKRYNGVKCAQTAVDAALRAVERIAGGWRDLDSIEIAFATTDVTDQSRDVADRRRPSTRDTANHSAVFSVAAALRDGDLTPAQFDDAHLRDPEILGLVDRIVIIAETAFDPLLPASNPARVRLTTRLGAVSEATVQDFPGHPNNPLTDDQLRAKFRSLCADKLPIDQVELLIDMIDRLEALDDLAPLLALTQPVLTANSADPSL